MVKDVWVLNTNRSSHWSDALQNEPPRQLVYQGICTGVMMTIMWLLYALEIGRALLLFWFLYSLVRTQFVQSLFFFLSKGLCSCYGWLEHCMGPDCAEFLWALQLYSKRDQLPVSSNLCSLRFGDSLEKNKWNCNIVCLLFLSISIPSLFLTGSELGEEVFIRMFVQYLIRLSDWPIAFHWLAEYVISCIWMFWQFTFLE